MNAKLRLRDWIWGSIAVLAVVFVVRWLPVSDAHAQTAWGGADRPFISPLPTPQPLSDEAKIALDYISTQHILPVEEMQIVNEHTRTYPLIGRTFKAFTIWTQDPGKFQDFDLLVEVESGVVEPNVDAIAAQEQVAYQARYGRLTPELYARLQQASDDELLPIAVWLAPDPAARTQEEIFAALAGQFPGAAESLVESGVPWTVEDAATAATIRQSYFAMLSEDALRSMQPLVEQIASFGVKATTLDPLPSLFAQLPKRDLLALAERKDVELIYLLENEAAPAMVEAAATDRMPTSWRQGSLSGAGRSIAVLEPDNIQNTGCLNIVASRPGVRPGGYDPNHKTWVASVLACNNATYRGIAYNANVIDAGFDDPNRDPDLAAATQWAVQTQNADVVNASFSSNSTQTMQWEDRVLDYWVRYGPTIIVVAAGNNTVNVTSPGKGWNVITVGAIDDQGTASWSDDAMWGGSNYANPTSTHNDREKPELAAPGASITMIGPGGNSVTRDGTSLAAPQTAGLAVLLMNRNAALVDRPEAVKAVLMAGAAHNVRDSRVMPSGQDLYDGAGSIDAVLSLQTAELGYTANNAATCDRPCWWATDSLNVAPGANVSRSFHATRGERIRVALAWFSNGDPFYFLDGLTVNYNRQVMAPSGVQVTDGYSASWDSTNELVEFVAPETGIYTIRAIRSASDTSTESNELGIAWSKQATYLPDVRQNIDGYSMITVRNDGAEPRQVRVTLFNGGYVDTPTTTLNPNQNWRVTLPANLGYGFAVVDGSEDLSVAVEQVGASQVSAYSGVQANPLGDPLWATTGGSLALPYVYRSYSGYTSSLRLLNTGAQAANVTLNYYDLNGFSAGQTTFNNLAALSAWTTQPTTGNGFYGSVAIQSSQPLAVLSDAYNTAIDISTQAGVGATSAYLPYIMRNYGGWNSCFVVRNLDNATNNVTITYYHSAGTTVESQSIAANAMWTRCQQSIGGMPDGPLSARIVSTSNRPFVLAINQSQVSAGKHMSYNGSQQGSRVVILPVLRRNHTENNRAWSSGFQVQNAGDANTCFAVSYFTPAGASIAGQSTGCLNPGYAQGFYLPNVTVNGMNDGLWSAVVTATQSIVVVANATCTSGCSGDNVYAYNGFGR
jgi:hypothetical protein